jgi:hypothetical protein
MDLQPGYAIAYRPSTEEPWQQASVFAVIGDKVMVKLPLGGNTSRIVTVDIDSGLIGPPF